MSPFKGFIEIKESTDSKKTFSTEGFLLTEAFRNQESIGFKTFF